MNVKTLDHELSVTGQIHPEDLPAIAQAGFRAVICNRPDGEAAGQPCFGDIERAAREHGLHAHYLPAESGRVDPAQAAAFAELMAGLPKPVLAYCRSGMRSATLRALSASMAG